MFLPSIIGDLLNGAYGRDTWTVGEVLSMWRAVQADDDRIAHGLRLLLPHAAAAPAGVTVQIAGRPTAAKLFPDVLIRHAGGVATMDHMVAAARDLLARQAPKNPQQLSLF